MNKNIAEVSEQIVKWMQEEVKTAGGKGAVFGLSGGLDSAVVAGLCKRAFDADALAVIMPCHSSKEDVEHAELVAKTFNLPYIVVDLKSTYDFMVEELKAKMPRVAETSQIALANIKPRLRMTTLYYYAACFNYLVMGTGNKSELAIGYFTKYGDGGVDLEPIGHLLKQEVKELAEYLSVPRVIIDKAPSGGLWEGQTDENELGFSYADLDHYLKYGEASPALQRRIEDLHRKSEHKRKTPPVPPIVL
ncbi:MAG: NAD(+) synthase [Clostridia bacterium]|nr:NAD(+) synthase [Clostridia bacterium]